MSDSKKVLVAYVSVTGNTKRMAELIAEGLRMGGLRVDVKKITEIKRVEDFSDYHAYLFGSPTYHRDMVEAMKKFLFLAKKADLSGKVGGAFGSYTHSGDAAKVIFDTMEYVLKMKLTSLGSFNLLEDKIDSEAGLRACQDYGKSIAEMLAA